jgi:hypothetical protein
MESYMYICIRFVLYSLSPPYLLESRLLHPVASPLFSDGLAIRRRRGEEAGNLLYIVVVYI